MTNVPSAKALAKRFLANAAQSAVEREKLRIDMGGGFVLRATWFDHDDLLAGVVMTQTGGCAAILLDQRLGHFKNGKWVDIQTREKACDTLAKQAVQSVRELTAALTASPEARASR